MTTRHSSPGNALILVLARLSPLILTLSACGAAVHDLAGTAAASLSSLVVLPWLAGLATASWVARGDSSDLMRSVAQRVACAVVVVSPLMALPGAVLGWTGVCLAFCLAALTSSYVALRR